MLLSIWTVILAWNAVGETRYAGDTRLCVAAETSEEAGRTARLVLRKTGARVRINQTTAVLDGCPWLEPGERP